MAILSFTLNSNRKATCTNKFLTDAPSYKNLSQTMRSMKEIEHDTDAKGTLQV